MGQYFEGLMRQTGLTFGPASPSVEHSVEGKTQSISPLESERRVFVDPAAVKTQQPAPPPPELSSSEPSIEPEPEPSEQELEAAPIDVLPLSEPVDDDSPGVKPRADERPVPTAELHVVGEISRPDKHHASTPLPQGPRPPSTPAPEPVELTKDDDRAEPESSVKPQTHPEPSPGQQIVRQALEWIGEENTKQEAVVEAETTERRPKSLPEEGRVIERSEPVVVQASVVEKEQSLHLSIGSIIMTLEGTPSEVVTQPEPQQDFRLAPASAPEPPIRLSRHYLRIR